MKIIHALSSQSTCGFVSVKSEDQKQLEEEFLPKAAENMLLLARHIHNILVSQGVSQVRNCNRRGLFNPLSVWAQNGKK